MSASKRRRVLAESGGGLLVSAPDVYGSKRTREVEIDSAVSAAEAAEIPSDAHAAMLSVLADLEQALGRGLPRVVLKHQLYAVVGDRTVADQQLEALRRGGDALLFKLGSVGDEDTAVMLTPDYRALVTASLPDAAPLLSAFLSVVTNPGRSLSVTKAELLDADGIEEKDILTLLRIGCVAMRDASSFWLSFPRTGVFLKSLRAGREQLARAVRNAKFREVLERDLLKRKFKGTSLPIRFLIADAVGCGALTSTPTTSGPLLKAPASGDR